MPVMTEVLFHWLDIPYLLYRCPECGDTVVLPAKHRDLYESLEQLKHAVERA